MCHFIFLPLSYSGHQIIIISIILFCGSYRLCFQYVDGANEPFITNHTEKVLSKLKPNDEIIILGILLQPIFFIDLVNNPDNTPFHLKCTKDMIIFNSKVNARWLSEIKLIPSPLVVNTSFIIDIILDENGGFNISFNEHTLFKINKRESLENVNLLDIYGNITLKSVKILHLSKDEDNSSKRTLIIGIAITLVLIIISGLGIFYILRRHCIRSKSKKTLNNDQESINESLESSRSKQTAKSNISYITGNSFLS
ncbi:unnamed protein product [Adineta steineri]|uniref:Galectin n=1 Tax=Adineta steineri TaxID=433720 RepID=A0A818IQE3_9BILA|nr:unnamed protein product [Adineta steineri]